MLLQHLGRHHHPLSSSLSVTHTSMNAESLAVKSEMHEPTSPWHVDTASWPSEPQKNRLAAKEQYRVEGYELRRYTVSKRTTEGVRLACVITSAE